MQSALLCSVNAERYNIIIIFYNGNNNYDNNTVPTYIYTRDTCRHLCLTERAYVNKLSSLVTYAYKIYILYCIVYCILC